MGSKTGAVKIRAGQAPQYHPHFPPDGRPYGAFREPTLSAPGIGEGEYLLSLFSL
jgi:hypothetical protein